MIPKIYGFNKASEIGNDVFAPSIFLGSCNLRCPYCMNSKLVKMNDLTPADLSNVKDFVKKENSKWLMISGGEPTCTPVAQLLGLLKEIKSWGCNIGMSTNGTNFNVICKIIKNINYIALDIKSDFNGYCALGGTCADYTDMMATRNFIWEVKNVRNDFDYEIRTTLFPPIVNSGTIEQIGEYIYKKDKWVLQQFRHSQNMIDDDCKKIKPYSDEDVKKIMKTAKQFCDNVHLRYV